MRKRKNDNCWRESGFYWESDKGNILILERIRKGRLLVAYCMSEDMGVAYPTYYSLEDISKNIGIELVLSRDCRRYFEKKRKKILKNEKDI
jgi:hypothetical protein